MPLLPIHAQKAALWRKQGQMTPDSTVCGTKVRGDMGAGLKGGKQGISK